MENEAHTAEVFWGAMSCHLGYVPQHAIVALVHVTMLGCFLQSSHRASTRLHAFVCSHFISHLVYHVLTGAVCASPLVSASLQGLWEAWPAASRIPLWLIALIVLWPVSLICIRSLWQDLAGSGLARSSWNHSVTMQAPAVIGALLLNWWWHDDRHAPGHITQSTHGPPRTTSLKFAARHETATARHGTARDCQGTARHGDCHGMARHGTRLPPI